MLHSSYLVLMVCCFPALAYAQPQARDTSLFEFQANSLSLRAHGDTVWAISPGRSTRVVDSADCISMRREKNGVVEDTKWIVRGAMAYRVDSTGFPIPVLALRGYSAQVESAKRFNSIMKSIRP